MAAESNMKIVNVSIKMLSGELITLEVPSFIIHKDFYRMVWMMIPEKSSLDSLDLLREGSDEPLSFSAEFLEPQPNEIFFAFIQTSYFTLYLKKISRAFLRNDHFIPGSSHYDVYEIVIHENYSSISPNSYFLPIPDENIPLDQDGNKIQINSLYNTHQIPFFVKYHSDAEDYITNMSPLLYDDLEVQVNVIDDNDWNIDIPDNKRSLDTITQLLDNFPVNLRTLYKLKRKLLFEWFWVFEEILIEESNAKLQELNGHQFNEDDDIGLAGQEFDEGEFDLSGNYWENNN
jgi:hypothetical protein